MPGMSLDELFDFNTARDQVQSKHQRMWLDLGLDALIMPPAPFAAPKIDMWNGVISYTAIWNLLDYPAAIIPVGTVKESDVADHGAKYGAQDEETYTQYTGPADYKDAPLTIQVVGLHQEDEHLALVVQELDRLLHC